VGNQLGRAARRSSRAAGVESDEGGGGQQTIFGAVLARLGLSIRDNPATTPAHEPMAGAATEKQEYGEAA
jgi:hypothetical protein